MQASETMLAHGLGQLEYELEQVRTLATTLSKDADITLLGHISLPPEGKDAYKAYSARLTYASLVSGLPSGMTPFACLPNRVVLAKDCLFYSPEEMYRLIFDGQFPGVEPCFAYYNGFSGSSRLFPERTVSVMGRAYPALVYSARVPLHSRSTKQFLFVMIDGEHVRELLSLSDVYPSAAARLYGEDGALLFERGDLSEGEDRLTRIQAQTSVGYGLRAELWIPNAIFSAQLANFTRLYAAFIGCYVTVGALFAVFLSYRSSRPILRILSTVAGCMPGGHPPRNVLKRQSAYQYLDGFIHASQNRFRDYEDLLSVQEDQLRAFTFQRLVRDADLSESERSRAQRYFASFPANYRLIAIALTYGAEMELERYSSCQVVLLSIVNQELSCYIAQFLGSQLVIVIDAQINREALDAALARIRTAIEKTDVATGRIAVSCAMSGVETLSLARRQTQLLLRASVSAVIHMEDSDQARDGVNASRIAQNGARFYNSLVGADARQAAEIVRETVSQVNSSGALNESMAAFLFYTFLGAIIRLRDEMGHMGVSERALPEFDPQANVEALLAPVGEYAAWAAGVIQRAREREAGAISQTLYNYIKENLSDAEMCAASAAEHLHMTENEVKRAMLKQTGKTFFDTLDGMRMARVRELLLTTDMPVSEIMENCGYHSLNTLYKAFRRTYGVSPSKMREQGKINEA